MRRRVLQTGSGFLVFGCVMTIGSVVGLAALSNTKVIASVAAGLAGSSVILLFDQLRRSEREAHRRDQYNRLLDVMRELPESDRGLAVDMFDGYNRARRSDIDLFRDSATHMLLAAGGALAGLGQGRYTCPREQRPTITQLYDLFDGPVYATTGTKDKTWWQEARGCDYLEHNRRAHEVRNVEIERVFILTELDEDISQIMKKNFAAGVTVRYVSASEVPTYLNVNVTIFGQDFVHEDRNNDDGVTTHYAYSTNMDDIARVRALYDELINLSGIKLYSPAE